MCARSRVCVSTCCLFVSFDNELLSIIKVECDPARVTMRAKTFNTEVADNGTSKHEKYSLRPRTSASKHKRSAGDDGDNDDNEYVTWKPTVKYNNNRKKQTKQKPPPLSKYRRKTANARERSRMREINDGFEALRRVLPQIPSENDGSGEKLTKISTLRLAMRYITALNRILRDTNKSPSASSLSPLAANDIESDGDSLFSGGEYGSSSSSIDNIRLSPVFGGAFASDRNYCRRSAISGESRESKPSKTSISLASSLYLPLPLDDDFVDTEFAIDAKDSLIDDVRDVDPLDGCLNDITFEDDEYAFDDLNYMANV